MKISILVDNFVDVPKLKAEHGLSILIEFEDENILFDCGQSDIVLGNAEIMGIDLNKITKIILSHGHYDHTGGLLSILKHLNKEIDVYAHPSIFSEKFSRCGDFYDSGADSISVISNISGTERVDRYIGIPEKRAIYEQVGARFLLISEPEEISRNIFFSGQISKIDEEISDDNLYTWANGIYTIDPLQDDISVFIKLQETLAVITGCAHSGILNILGRAIELNPGFKKIAIIGGLHFSKKDDLYIDNIISELKKYSIELFVPMHCTGADSYVKLKNEFGCKCLAGAVGKVLKF